MRNTLLLPLLMAPLLTRAQDDGDLRLGVKLAPNFHWLRSDSKELKRDGSGLGYTFGLVSELAIDDRQAYYFSSGVLFNHIGGAFTATFSKEVDGVSTSIRSKQELRINYLEVPMTLKLRAVNDNPLTFYGQFGASAGFKLRARSTFTTTTTANGTSTTVSDTDDVLGDINLMRFGLVVGAGAEYALTGASLFGGLTYNNAFSNLLGKDAKRLVNENSKSKLYASYLEITAGVFF